MNCKYISSRQIILFFAALFMLSISAFADFPPVLVVDGTASPGIFVFGMISGHRAYGYAYTGTNGVLVLQGDTGGQAGWATDAMTALQTPTITGTWNGSSSVSVAGHAIAVPEVLVYYPSSTAAVALQGYDGASHSPIGSGTANGAYVMAYNGLGSGYIFTSGSTSPVYRYQASTAGPLSLDTSSGWPPRNLYAYPAQIVDDAGKTLTATSFTEGFDSVGYWSNVTYEDTVSGHTGGLSIVIDAHDSGGELSGYIDGVGVDIAWNASINAFPPSSGMGVTVNPQTGPPQVEWNGNLLPFKWSDVMGSDVYGDTSGRVATINVDGNFMITDSYTTITDTWNEGTQRFGFEDNSPQGHPDIAPVSADGLSLLGITPGLTILTTSSASGAIFSGFNDGNGSQWPIGPYTLKKSDGTVINEYDTATLGLASNFAFSFSRSDGFYGSWSGPFYYISYDYSTPTFYVCNGTRTIDATSVFPAPDITFPVSTFNCNVAPVNESYPQDSYYVFGQADMVSNGGLSISYYGPDSQGNYINIFPSITGGTFGSASASTNNGSFSFSNFQTLFTSGTLTSDDGSTIFGLGTIYQAAPNPPEIGWNGKYFWFSYLETNGAETYYDSSSDKITIGTSGSVTVTPVGVTPITGSYNPVSCTFSFGTNASMWNVVALDGAGNPLGGLSAGTTPGVVIYGDPYDQNFGQAIQLADGSVINASVTNSCMFWSTDYSCYAIKYIGIADGTFFIAQGQQDYSQVYKCKYPTGGGDLEISFYGDYSVGGYWSDTNIYPNGLYINGLYAAIDSTTLSQGGSGQSPYGGVSYHTIISQETFSIAWTWAGGFSGGVNGSYGAFSGFTGTWDGGDVFGSLPTGLVISTQPPPAYPTHGGPQSVSWDGIQMTFNPVASLLAGADVYNDTSGLGFTATIAPGTDGGPDSITLTGANGTQFTGTYNPATLQFSFEGQNAGTVLAVNNDGQLLVPTTPVGGSGGGTGSSAGTSGNFDIQGNVLSLGSWTQTSGGTMNGLSIVYTDTQGGQPSLLSFMAARQSVGWIWSHADTDGGSNQVTMMQLDATNRLMLSGTANPSTPTIILDPNGKSHIEPQGNLDMGTFTVHP